MSTHEAWWRRDYPWPRMPSWFAGVAAFLALAGIVTTGFDSGCWFLTPPGVALVAFGRPWLIGHLGVRSARAIGVLLSILVFASAIRWLVSDEIWLGAWILAGAILMVGLLRPLILSSRG